MVPGSVALGRVSEPVSHPVWDDDEGVMMRRSLLVLACLLALALVASACGGGSTEPAPAPTPTSSAPTEPTKVTKLTYGVFGSPEEIASYQAVVDAYNAKASTVEVDLVTWPTSAAMMADVDAGTEVPDIYMVARSDLAQVVDAGLNVPLFNLLEDRNISYGDGYARDALEAFSDEADLQCMPYSVSPMVVYINTDLVDFATIRDRGLPAPAPELRSWNIEEFRTAAQFATRKRMRSRGVSITPHLTSIAPFLYSGGGQLYDDDDDPTSLDLSSDSNQATLTTILEVLRNPRITLTNEQLAKASPTEWFEKGRLGMVEGFRSLTPELRAIPGLHFDVMPVPRVDSDATVGDISGLCIAPGRQVQKAADFLVHAISPEGYDPVVAAGYVVPASLPVARSDAFLQPDQQPAHGGTFNAGVDNMVLEPLLPEEDELAAVVDPLLEELFTAPTIDDIATVTAEIDEASRAVLDPDYVPTPSGSPTDGSSTSDGSEPAQPDSATVSSTP